MEESYREDPANHPGPESCADAREDVGEALTGENAGEVLSREIKHSGAPTLLTEAEGETERRVLASADSGSARSETLDMRGNSMRENREISRSPDRVKRSGRSGKGGGPKPEMHDREKSDDFVVPTKHENKVDSSTADRAEGRRSASGSPNQRNTRRTQCRTIACQPSESDAFNATNRGGSRMR